MGIFYNKQEEINNSQVEKKTNIFTKTLNLIKVLFFILNIFSLAIYTTYSLYMAYNSTKSTIFSHIIVFLLISYAVAFLCLIFFGLKDKKKLKSNLKTYKSSVKILKQCVKLLNITISIVTAFNIFFNSGKLTLLHIIFGILSIVIAILSILFEVLKIVIRKKLEKYKLKKQQLKESQNNI